MRQRQICRSEDLRYTCEGRSKDLRYTCEGRSKDLRYVYQAARFQ